MRIHNVHERRLHGPVEPVGELVDGLAGPEDRLWPWDKWPPMKLDLPLMVGSDGGHGLVRYAVSEYEPGRRIVFRFHEHGLTKGMIGGHHFEVVDSGEGNVVLRHVIQAECDFKTWLRWAGVIRPLHDALLEDALDRAERVMNPQTAASAKWSPWVRFLRFLLRRGK
jgi:hypothetical protein